MQGTPSAKVWTKPLSGGRQAVLTVNMGAQPADLVLNMTAIAPQLACAKGTSSCMVSDVWRNTTLGQAGAGGSLTVRGLAPHDSEFLIFG
jgi:hypothetical protein